MPADPPSRMKHGRIGTRWQAPRSERGLAWRRPAGGGTDRGLKGENHGPFGRRISIIPDGPWFDRSMPSIMLGMMSGMVKS
jgi:hypothetical protein